MPMVFGSISEDLLHRFDAACAEKGVNRSQGLSIAIEHYLNNGDKDKCTERDNLSATCDNLRTALDNDFDPDCWARLWQKNALKIHEPPLAPVILLFLFNKEPSIDVVLNNHGSFDWKQQI